jgi:hypothetical protein
MLVIKPNLDCAQLALLVASPMLAFVSSPSDKILARSSSTVSDSHGQPHRQGSLQVVTASSVFLEHVHGLPIAGVRSQDRVFVCVAPAQGQVSASSASFIQGSLQLSVVKTVCAYSVADLVNSPTGLLLYLWSRDPRFKYLAGHFLTNYFVPLFSLSARPRPSDSGASCFFGEDVLASISNKRSIPAIFVV